MLIYYLYYRDPVHSHRYWLDPDVELPLPMILEIQMDNKCKCGVDIINNWSAGVHMHYMHTLNDQGAGPTVSSVFIHIISVAFILSLVEKVLLVLGWNPTATDHLLTHFT